MWYPGIQRAVEGFSPTLHLGFPLWRVEFVSDWGRGETDTRKMRKLNRAATETTDRKHGRTEASTGDFWPFFKNSHCLYAKSLRIWKPYQLGSNISYALLTMTRSRYLEKYLSKEMPVEILPRTSCQPVTTCRAGTGWTIWAVFVFTSPSLTSLMSL